MDTAAPHAVLWDMDGTLVDTEPYWIEVETELVERHGGTWTREHAMACVGNELIVSGRYLREHGGVDLTPEEIVDVLVAGVADRLATRVPWRDGARELLVSLRDSGVPCALVTMSYRSLVNPVVAALPADTFAAVVTGDEVAHGKPHPEPYLTAARRLGVRAEDTLAIEDSETGARSAEAAGCTVLVVPNHVVVAEGPRRCFVDSLNGLHPETFSGAVAR